METIKITKRLADAARANASKQRHEDHEHVSAVLVLGRPGYMFGEFAESSAEDLVAMTALEAEAFAATPLTDTSFAHPENIPFDVVSLPDSRSTTQQSTRGNTDSASEGTTTVVSDGATTESANSTILAFQSCPRRPQELLTHQVLKSCLDPKTDEWYANIHEGGRGWGREVSFRNLKLRLSTDSVGNLKFEKTQLNDWFHQHGIHKDERTKFWDSLNIRVASGPAETLQFQIIEILPPYVQESWFSTLSVLLKEHKIDVYWRDTTEKQIDLGNIIHKKKPITALSFVFLAQRMHSAPGAAQLVFSYSPGVIAKDVRAAELGELIGTQFTNRIFHCILHQMYDNEESSNSDELRHAAADLLTAQFRRKSHGKLFNVHKTDNVIARKLTLLLESTKAVSLTSASGKPSMRLLGVKIGLIYGAVVNYVVDLEKEGAWNREVVASIIRTVGNAAGAAFGLAPFPTPIGRVGKEGIKGIADITATLVTGGKMTTSHKDEILRVINHFKTDVIENARRGFVVAREARTSGITFTPELLANYANVASSTLKTVVSPDVLVKITE